MFKLLSSMRVGGFKLSDNMAIVIDWLQVNATGRMSDSVISQLELQPYSTRVFKSVYILRAFTEDMATIACNPLSPVIPSDTHLIKFHNKLLYSTDLEQRIEYTLNFLGLTFKGLSRLDLAHDFNKFANNLLPHNLINRFLLKKWLHVGKQSFKVYGKGGVNQSFETLRFGKNDSELSVYLYNKSIELNQVKDKPWIREFWQHNAISQSNDVWRLEVSLKGNRLHYVDESSGNIERLSLSNIFDQLFLHKLYFSLVDKYFKFVRPETNRNISRMKQVQLFDECYNKFYFIKLNDKKESDRSVKIFIKKLEEFNSIVRQIKKDNQADISEFGAGLIVLQSVIELYDKQRFYEKKVKGKYDNNK